MAVIKQCDRCKKVFKYDDDKTINAIEMQHVNESNTYYRAVKHYDLCPECVNSLQKWFGVGGEHEESE